MKSIIFTCIAAATLLSPANAAPQSSSPIAQPKIVGGELATKGEFPWMSALVVTYNQVTASLEVADKQYASTPFSYSPSGQASASMADCGIGDNQCESATGKICLISRGEIDFSVKADNCQAGGGIGVIIYNNVSGDLSGTLGDNFSGIIPVVAISQDDGNTLLSKLDEIATINIATQPSLVQSANCGASFIGDKWVITASHCVEDVNIEMLKVNIGEYDLSDGASNAKAIKRIYMHPEYNTGADYNNDIALIELVETVDHPAVTLLDYDTSRELALANTPATVIGWGNIKAYGPNDESPPNSQPDQLRQVELSLLSNEQCKDKLARSYSDLYNATFLPSQVGITDSMLCAEYLAGEKGSCQGDSGGPLVVNTNEGWQQIGVVSYGVGCAAAEFPDVYARIGQFTSWIDSITKGIAIEPSHDFAITAQKTIQTKQLNVTNNSDFSANLSFSITSTNGSSAFSLVTDSCTNLASKQSCELTVNFDAEATGFQDAVITINSNDTNIPTSQAFISAQAIAANSDINTQLSSGSSELLWFSGGDESWLIDTTEAAIMSGAIGDNQESSAMLTFTGAGSLSFDWSVSSEENIDDPESPYDALYLIIDGEQVDFISGVVAYSNVTKEFTDGDHQVTWIYKKDGGVSEEEDTGYLKNVIFTPKVVTTPVTTPVTEVTSNSSGGSSTYFLLIMLSMIGIIRRR
jgi:secreted trypsin-like serine protease